MTDLRVRLKSLESRPQRGKVSHALAAEHHVLILTHAAPEKHTEGRCDSGKAQTKKGKGAPTATSEQLGKLATVQQRIEVLDWYHANGKNQSKTARHFNAKYPHLKIKQPLVSAWVKAEDKWREEYEKSGVNGHKMKPMRQSQHPEITDMMDLWVTKAMEDGLLLTGEVLCQKWKAFADLRGVPEDERLGLSEGWLTRFKKRNKNFKPHGEAGSADLAEVEAERERIKAILAKYELRDIYNMDETGLFYGSVHRLCTKYLTETKHSTVPPDRGLADKKHSGVKGSKVRLTYAFTVNADGSDKKEPFIIGKAHKPRPFQKKSGA